MADAERSTELFTTEWDALAMHHRRGALLLVDAEIALPDVARALAADEADQVRQWLEAGRVRRPTPDEVSRWEAEQGEHFVSAIVQPYVLAQRRS